MTLLEPTRLVALAIIPIAAILLLAARALRRSAVRRFFGPQSSRIGLLTVGRTANAVASIAFLVGMALVAVALARPAHDPKPQKVQRAGRDVVFIVDVSRSMLAEDIRPNRLERAKLAIRDVLDVVRGDRVGIVAFAGTPLVVCPLTTDYAFARLVLDELSPDSVTRGGTAIGDALRTATQLLTSASGDDAKSPDGQPAPSLSEARFRDVFLFTDGEDHESDPVKAAGVAGKSGIRITAIGLGSDSAGAAVPKPVAPAGTDPRLTRPRQSQEAMEYQGRPVVSKMDPDSLRQIAEAGAEGSRFLNVGTGHIELDRLYTRMMQDSERRRLESTETIKYSELFQYFLAAALTFLMLEPILQAFRRR